VDNGSTDDSVFLLESFEPKIKLIKNKKNEGVSKARNKALKISTGDYLWILDIDTVVNIDAFNGMLALLKDNLSVGLCGCKLVDSAGLVQDSCRKYPTLKYKFKNLLEDRLKRIVSGGSIHTRIQTFNDDQFYHLEMKDNKPFKVDYVIGACQMFRRDILDKVGYLDEAIFYGPEDADFCKRIHNSGFEVMYLPDISIIHHYNRDTNSNPFSMLSFHHIKGLLHFWRKSRTIQKVDR